MTGPNILRAERGFTLMEMLVVLVVIGLIAVAVLPQVTNMLESSKHKAANLQLETLSQSLEFYMLDMGAYPSSDEGLGVLWEDTGDVTWNGPYVRRQAQLVDPWGREFDYEAPADGAAYALSSLGADGVEGGRGDDADLSFSPGA